MKILIFGMIGLLSFIGSLAAALAMTGNLSKESLQRLIKKEVALASNSTSSGVLYLGVQVEGCLEDDGAEADYMNQLLREFPDSPEARRVADAN